MPSNQISIHTRDIEYELPEGLIGDFKLVQGIRDPDLISNTDFSIFIINDKTDLETYINALSENKNIYVIANHNILNVFELMPYQFLIEDEDGKIIEVKNEMVYLIKSNITLKYAIIIHDRLITISQQDFNNVAYMKKLLQNLINKLQRQNIQIYDTNNPIPKPVNYIEPVKSNIISSQRVNINALATQISAGGGNNNNNFDYERINPFQDIPQMGGVAPINPANFGNVNALQNLAVAIPNVVMNKWVLLGVTSSVIVGGLIHLLYKNPIFGKLIESKIPDVTNDFINMPSIESVLPSSGKIMSELFIDHLKKSDVFSDDEKTVLNPALDNITIEENLTPGDTNITPDYLVPSVTEPNEQVRLNVYEPVFEEGKEFYGPDNMPLYGPENMPLYGPENQQTYGREVSTYVINIGKTYNKDITQKIIPQTLNVLEESLDVSKNLEQYESSHYLFYISAGALLVGLLYKFIAK